MANRGILNIKPNDKYIKNKYLFYFLCKNKNIYSSKGTGAVLKHFYGPNLMNEEINLPSIKTQDSVIGIIEPIEKLENNISMQVNKINILLKNLEVTNQKIKLFNILEPIKNFPKNLKQVSAKVLMKNTTLISNLEEKGTYSTNSFYCPKGTFLFCSIRTYLQKYCILPIEADVNGTLFQFKIKENFTSLLTSLHNEEF